MKQKLPEIGGKVNAIIVREDVIGIYVALPDYNNAEGMILYSDLVSPAHLYDCITSGNPIRHGLVPGQKIKAIVLRVDYNKGYMDLTLSSDRPVDTVRHAEPESYAARVLMRQMEPIGPKAPRRAGAESRNICYIAAFWTAV